MSRRVFGCARLTFHVLLLHSLARCEVLRITRALRALAGSPLGLPRGWRRGLRSTLRHRDGRDAKQRKSKNTAADRSHVALLHWIVDNGKSSGRFGRAFE